MALDQPERGLDATGHEAHAAAYAVSIGVPPGSASHGSGITLRFDVGPPHPVMAASGELEGLAAQQVSARKPPTWCVTITGQTACHVPDGACQAGQK